MDDRVLQIMATAGMLILCAVGFAIYRLWMGKTEVARAMREREENDRLVEAGLRTRDGFPTCLICGIRATEYAPITGVSWMDKVPLLNRLYSLAPRHIIVDNIEGDICYCQLHKQLAVALLDEQHAEMRSERARFNAAQAQRVIALDGGGIHKMLVEKHGMQLRSLRLAETPLPQLQAPREDEEISVAVVSSTSMIPEEDS